MKNMDQGIIMKALDYAYDKAINGVAGLDSAIELGDSYLEKHDEPSIASQKLVLWQVSKAGTAGFISGLGGLITLPVAVPANIASVLYIQVRMIAAIAHIGGHDVHDDRVQALCYMCMAGSGAADAAKDIGIKIGTKITEKMISNISRSTINQINKAVGFRLVTKFGSTGAINLGKAVPIVGGLLSGTIDSVTTKTIGSVAIKTFVTE